MTVLAVDSASRARVWVVVSDDDGSVIEQRELPGGELDRRLPAVLAELLTPGIRAVVVLTGPGSYSGVRVGMAAALGVAAARGLALHGVGNLTALATVADIADAEFTVVSDAGRGGVYMARFSRHGSILEQLASVERVTAAAAGPGRVFATTAIDGLVAEQVDPVRVLAAAVPLSLALPPLPALGLRAIHVGLGGHGPRTAGKGTPKAL